MRPTPRTLTPPDTRRGARSAVDLGIVVALASVTIALFARTAWHDFVLYDDPDYVRNNPIVAQGLTLTGVVWAFTTGHAANWHPVTWLSHMLDCQLFGLAAGGHHLTSVVLHAANAVLLFVVLRDATGQRWPSAVVAALFALHPLHVESVAWVSDRKGVLSTLFFLLTVRAYVRWVRHPTRGGYAMIATFFALGLMSKPMLVTLPFVLLLLDVWPLGRLSLEPTPRTVAAPERQPGKRRRESSPKPPPAPAPASILRGLVIEKLPLFFLAALSSVVTFLAQRNASAVAPIAQLSLPGRLGNAILGYALYIRKTAWPSDLTFFYPQYYPPPLLPVLGCFALLAGVSLIVLRQRTRPYLAVGWLIFLGTLVPVSGVVQVGDQAMADRYTYLSLIGIFVMLAWGGAEIAVRRREARDAVATVAGLALASCAVVSWAQVGYWRDSTTLFEHALAVTARNHVAHNALGFVLLDAGRTEDAIAHFEEALRLRPGYPDAHANLGRALAKLGRTTEAASHYAEAIRLEPAAPAPHLNLAAILIDQGRIPDAESHLLAAQRSDPDSGELHRMLAILRARQGRAQEAEAEYRAAAALDPSVASIHNDLGLLLADQGRLDEAHAELERALQADPRYAMAHNNMAMLLERVGDVQGASAQYRRALELDPLNGKTHYNYGALQSDLGNFDEAMSHLQQALRLQPEAPEPHYGLGLALERQGRTAEAADEYRAALRIRPGWQPAVAKLASLGD